ncbi:hypothetical protein DFH08DRAFT_810017 [Mycena albidolilacea]|uniref:Uncharacterized protein n=1 Tax=Mycena albidolilacea TaxID=1033008 RepID=A0AAD7ER03_9AGAR|nr:hypothetical protein DFH08DRAFT_810017 [Mycena albidolilacea]
MSILALDFDHYPRDAHCLWPYSYTELVALPYSPYKLEGPGHLYFPLCGTATSNIDAFLDGTALTQMQFDFLQINTGYTTKFEWRFGEYHTCSINGPHDHTVILFFFRPHMADEDNIPLTAAENPMLRALLTRSLDDTDCFSSPTFKSLVMWFPRVKSTTLDLIIDGKFEAEDLVKLGSHSTEAREKGRPVMWFPQLGVRSPRLLLERLGVGPALRLLKAFPSIVPLMDAWTTYMGIHALCDPTSGSIAAAFTIYTSHFLQFSMQYEWNVVLLYPYKFLCIRLPEKFRPTRWTIPDGTLVSTCLVHYPLTATSASLSVGKKCALG